MRLALERSLAHQRIFMASSQDAGAPVAAQQAQTITTVWKVSFEVQAQEELDEDFLALDGWVADELILGGGDDGESIVARVKAHAFDPEAYGITTTAFKLTGLEPVVELDLI
jgi:hypothetical protein